jgi:hypothetical protein
LFRCTTNTAKDTTSETFKRSLPSDTSHKVSVIPCTLFSEILCKAFLASLRGFRNSFLTELCSGAADKATFNLVLYDIFNRTFGDCTSQLLVKTRSAGDTTEDTTKSLHIEVLAAVRLSFISHELCLFFRHASFAGTCVHGIANCTLYGTNTRGNTKGSGSGYTCARRSGSGKRNCRAYDASSSIKRVNGK